MPVNPPDRRDNSHLERLATVESRLDFFDEFRREQRESLEGINQSLQKILVQLESHTRTREALDSAFVEIRDIKKNHQALVSRIDAELPDLHNIRRIVYGTLALITAGALSAWGIVIHNAP